MTDQLLLAEPIRAGRISLVLVPPEVLTAVAATTEGGVDWRGVGRIDPIQGPAMPAARRLDQLAGDPGVAPWLLRGILVADESTSTGLRVAGHIGGHDRPDRAGMVEVGYAIRPADRGAGLATEAAAMWFAWAHRHGARLARLSIAPGNAASLAVARRLGLREVTRVWDRDDARWEIVLEHELPLVMPVRAASGRACEGGGSVEARSADQRNANWRG